MSVVFIDYEEDDPSSKMNRCKHRSLNKESGNTGCCGGKKLVTSFRCNKRNIFPLKDSTCVNCQVFEPK